MATRLYLKPTADIGISTYQDLTIGHGVIELDAYVTPDNLFTELPFLNLNDPFEFEPSAWVSPEIAEAVTLTSATLFIWGEEDDTATTNTGVRAKIYKRSSGGTETELAGGPFDSSELPASINSRTVTCNFTDTAFVAGDRIVLKLFATPVGGAWPDVGDLELALIYWGETAAAKSDSYLEFAETIVFETAPVDPVTGMFAITFEDELLSVATSDGGANAVGAVSAGMFGIGLASYNGRLWTVDQINDLVVEIDPNTGDTLSSFNVGIDFTGEGDLALKADGTGWIVTNAPSPKLYSLDVPGGLAAFIANLTISGSGDPLPLDSLAIHSNGTVYAIEQTTPALYTLDTATGIGTLIGSLGIGTVGGAAGAAFDADDVLYFVDSNSGDVYTVNLLTGAGTALGASGFNSISGLAFIPAEESEGTTIRAQVLFDRVDWYPDCGDAFEHIAGGTSGDIELRAASILRGDAHGVIIEESTMIAAPDIKVTAMEDPGAGSGGEADTDDQGGYETGENHVRGDRDAKVQAQMGAVFPEVTIPFYARKRHRVCLMATGGANYQCIEADGPRQWLHVSFDTSGAIIRTYFLPSFILAFQSAAYPGIDGFEAMRVDTRRGSLWLLGKAGSTPYDYNVLDSHDGGLTATEVLSLTADSAVIERDSERGVGVILYETGGTVLRQETLDGGATWSSAEQPTLDGVPMEADDVVDITSDSRRANMVMIILVGGEASVVESLDLGATWVTRLS